VPTKDIALQVQGKAARLCLMEKKLPCVNGGWPAAYPNEAAWLCLNDKKNYLVQMEDGPLHIPSEGSLALLERQKNYLVLTKDGPPHSPAEGSMALLENDKKTTW
jgi:hypothetical protein